MKDSKINISRDLLYGTLDILFTSGTFRSLSLNAYIMFQIQRNIHHTSNIRTLYKISKYVCCNYKVILSFYLYLSLFSSLGIWTKNYNEIQIKLTFLINWINASTLRSKSMKFLICHHEKQTKEL